MPSVESLLDDFLDACALGGLQAFEWQATVLATWLGLDDLGRWAARNCGLSVPRQNGKTLGTSEVRMNGGLLLLGERIVYTSHLQKTSTETFEDMATFSDSCAKMRKRVSAVKTALGREEIVLKNGGRVKFLARTRNGGRGQHGDLLVFDEAQELSDEQQASFLPALAASANPQTIYTGTPPDENAPGSVFSRIRADALGGRTRTTAWAEWGVSEIGDVTDKSRWYETNPSAGVLILESSIEGECEQMAPDRFARERLGWWSERRVQEDPPVIGAEPWSKCLTLDPPEDGVVVFAVRFSKDGDVGVIAAAVKPDDGPVFVEIVDVFDPRSDFEKITWWFVEREDAAALFVIDGKSYAGALSDALAAESVARGMVKRPSADEAVSAFASFASAVASGSVEHIAQAPLDEAAQRCPKRSIGNIGGWGFESTEDADATVVEAAAFAYWGAVTTNRDQRRELLIG